MNKNETKFEMHNLAAKLYKNSDPPKMEKLYDMIFALRTEGCYMTGPIIVRKNFGKDPFTEIMLPLNKMPDDEKEFRKYGTVAYDECFYTREVINGKTITELSEKADTYFDSIKGHDSLMIFALINVSGGLIVDSFIPTGLLRSRNEQL